MAKGGWIRRVAAHLSGRGSPSAKALLVCGRPSRLIGTVCGVPGYVSTLEARAWDVRVAKGWKAVHSRPKDNWHPVERHSPETRAILSAVQKGKKKSPEHCKRIGDAKRGIPKSPETRAKLSASRMGIPPSNKGTRMSPELRAKYCGRVNSPETLLKMSLSAKRRDAARKRGPNGRYGSEDAS